MNISGSCFCGLIEYEAELDLSRVGLCHCRDCQIFSGSAFRTSGIVPPEHFRFTKGTPKYFEKVADSGAVRTMAFCSECGTHLCSLPSENSRDYVSIRVASCREFDQLHPAFEIFCASRVAWLPGLDGVTEHARMLTTRDTRRQEEGE